MDYRLIAFDLDGTFLDSEKNIPERNMAALKATAEKGVYAVPATGRIFAGIPEELKSAPFIRYYVCINGAYVYDSAEDEVVYRAEIPVGEALRFYEYMDTLPVYYDCYQDNTGWMTESMLENAADFMPDRGILRLIKTLRIPVPELKAALRAKDRPIQKLQVYCRDQELRSRLLRDLPELFPELLFSSSVSSNIEVNSRDAGKDKGLAALCARLGFGMQQAIAFGDGINDADMLRAAGLGIAMENAEEQVKAAADYTTSDNNSGGVGAAIEKFILRS